MSRPYRYLLLWVGVFFFLNLLMAETSVLGFAREPATSIGKLEPGLTAEQVRQQVGTPKRIARQILYHRHLEQWIYDQPAPVRLHFDCPRGEKPQLVWKQILSDDKNERESTPNVP